MSPSSFVMRPFGAYHSGDVEPSHLSRRNQPAFNQSLPSSVRSSSSLSSYSYDSVVSYEPHYEPHYEPAFPVIKIEDQRSWELITRLMAAASSNQIKLVTELIKSELVSPDAQDSKHNTALLYASINGHMNVVRKLIELGVNVNYIHPYTQNTALHLAAQCGHTRTVELLLKSGEANARLTNREGKTSYQLAKDFGHGNNKVMKRLFQECGAISCTRRQASDADDDDSHPDSDGECDSTTPSSPGGSSRTGHSDRDKDHSLLPNIELLSIFANTGIYRPLSSGKGFVFLTPTCDIYKMINYSRIALGLPIDAWNELKDELFKIQLDFEEDLLLVKQVEYRRVMNADVGRSTSTSNVSANSSTSCCSQPRRSRRSCTETSTHVPADPETELQAYQVWKQFNMSWIQEMINTLDTVLSNTPH